MDDGEIKTFNIAKGIAIERDLPIILWHSFAMKQARTGELPNVSVEQLSDNQRKINQVRALNLIISSQREMITISRSIIKHRSIRKWTKKYKTEEEQDEHPFEEDDNDYNKLMYWQEMLLACEKDIIEAERTKNKDDDFLIKIDTPEGETFRLTENFHNMLAELENSYEEIHLLMLLNKIVSAGIEEDEEMTYKEKEEEAIRRIVEA